MDEVNDYNYLANLLLHEDKKFYDRANFFIVAQGMLFSAFAALISGSNNLTGLYKSFPAVICLTGVILNGIWWSSGDKKKIEKLKEVLKANLKGLESKMGEFDVTPTITDLIYKWAPLLLGIAWSSMLVCYLLQVFGVIRI